MSLRIPYCHGLMIAALLWLALSIAAALMLPEAVDQEILWYHGLIIWFPTVIGAWAATWVLFQVFRYEGRNSRVLDTLIGFVEIGVVGAIAYKANFSLPDFLPNAVATPVWIVVSIAILVGWRLAFLTAWKYLREAR